MFQVVPPCSGESTYAVSTNTLLWPKQIGGYTGVKK